MSRESKRSCLLAISVLHAQQGVLPSHQPQAGLLLAYLATMSTRGVWVKRYHPAAVVEMAETLNVCK